MPVLEEPAPVAGRAVAREEISRERAEPQAASRPQPDDGPHPCVMVIFGASGDLTRRKLALALYNLERDSLLEERFAVIGFARTPMDDDVFRDTLLTAVRKAAGPAFVEGVWKRFAARLHYVTGGYEDPASYAGLSRRLDDLAGECRAVRVVYYLSVPPSVAEKVLSMMKSTGLASHAGVTARIMLEKPFGLDLESARRMNSILASIFEESEVYRVDHYLGKDTIRNLLLLRFANSIFEPLWNRRCVDHIQITAAEDIGLEGRGGYYDEAGVVRDMVQNHVLQVLSLIGMDPPVAGDAESVRDRKLDVMRSIGPIGQDDFVFGQYRGYRDERGVAADSRTPTFVAVKLALNNWRWFGVPVYVRAGKALARKFTEVTVVFRQVPLCILEDQALCADVRPNVIYVRIQPDEGVRLSFSVKVPGRYDEIGTATMDFSYSQFGREIPDAYERVLLDGLRGVATLFWRADAVEAAWKVVAPLLEAEAGGPPPAQYEPGGWGPPEAQDLLARNGAQWVSSY